MFNKRLHDNNNFYEFFYFSLKKKRKNVVFLRPCFGLVVCSFFMSPFVLLLLYRELHFLYSALIDIGEDEGVAQGFSLFHRLLYVGHLALGKYVLEEEGRTIARHKAYVIGKR